MSVGGPDGPTMRYHYATSDQLSDRPLFRDNDWGITQGCGAYPLSAWCSILSPAVARWLRGATSAASAALARRQEAAHRVGARDAARMLLA